MHYYLWELPRAQDNHLWVIGLYASPLTNQSIAADLLFAANPAVDRETSHDYLGGKFPLPLLPESILLVSVKFFRLPFCFYGWDRVIPWDRHCLPGTRQLSWQQNF